MRMTITKPEFEQVTIEAIIEEGKRMATRCGRPVYVLRDGNELWTSTIRNKDVTTIQVVTPGSYTSKMQQAKLYSAPMKRQTSIGDSFGAPPMPKPRPPAEPKDKMHSADVGEALTRMMRKD